MDNLNEVLAEVTRKELIIFYETCVQARVIARNKFFTRAKKLYRIKKLGFSHYEADALIR